MDLKTEKLKNFLKKKSNLTKQITEEMTFSELFSKMKKESWKESLKIINKTDQA